MKTLYLHVGLHKTGTSSIQKSCLLHRDKIKEQGFLYFNESPSGRENFNGNGSSWIRYKESYKTSNFRSNGVSLENINLLAKRMYNTECEKVIFSAENISWVFSKEELIKLKEALEEYFEVKIVIYLRRQDKLAISLGQQASKVRASIINSFIGNDGFFFQDPETYKEYFDFNYKVGKWIDAFGDNNVIVRLHDTEALIEGDATSDFFSTIGVNYSGFSEIRENESNGYERTKIGHLLNDSNINEELAKVFRLNSSNIGKCQPNKVLAEQFYSCFRESNIALNSRLNLSLKNEALFSDDFDMYKEDNFLLWDDDTANLAIINIFNTLSKLTIRDFIKIKIKNKVENNGAINRLKDLMHHKK